MAGGLVLHGYATNTRLCPWDTGYPGKYFNIEGNMDESV